MKNTKFDSFEPTAVLFGSRSIDEKIYNHASINKSKAPFLISPAYVGL